MAVRPGTGEFKPQLLQADTAQQSALKIMTPKCAIGCVCVYTCNNMCEPSQTVCLHSRTAPLPPLLPRRRVPRSLLGGQDSLELSEVQKPQKLTI